MLLPVSLDDWLNFQLGAAPLTLSLLIVVVSGLLIMAMHRKKGMLLICAGGIGLAIDLAEPYLSTFVLNTLLGWGTPVGRVMFVYWLINNTGWATVMLLLLWAALVRRNAQPEKESAFAVLPVLPLEQQDRAQ